MPEAASAVSFPTCDAVTVLWKSAPFLPALFDGLAACDYPRDRWRMHFVDNNPGDGSLVAVQELRKKYEGRLPEIIIHSPKTNTGFAGGNNLVFRQAIAEKRDFVYLHNHDAAFEPACLREAVAVAQSDARIGSVQSLIVLADQPDVLNSSGNAIHFLGYGYCAGYLDSRGSAPSAPVDIAFASGAGVLYPVPVLAKVGGLDETLWLYHEDLELGWRIALAGYRNVLAPRSVLRHKYEFSRSIQKWFWMERNRLAVVIKNYRLATLILLLPGFVAVEIATWLFALKGGWVKEKAKAAAWFFRQSTWAYLFRGRREIAALRVARDRDLLARFTADIDYQGVTTPFIAKVANPLMRIYRRVVLLMVCW